MRLRKIALSAFLLFTAQSQPQDLNTAANNELSPAQIRADLEKAHEVYIGSVGRRIARGFEYDFQRVQQPNFVVTGSGSLLHNPENYLNEHTLKFVFSELFPNTATLAGAWKNACGLIDAAPECKDPSGNQSELKNFDIRTLVTAGSWWRRAAAGLTMNADLSERSALQQGVIVVNSSFSNHYQVTGGIDFDPSALFINGANWSKAIEPFKSAPRFCAHKVALAKQNREDTEQAKIDCVRDFSLARLQGDAEGDRSRATSLLAAVLPAISFKRVSQFDFVKNGGILIPAPYLANAQTQLTFKWDLKKAFPGPTAMLDADAVTEPKKEQSQEGGPDTHGRGGTRLCVVVSGAASSVITVSADFPAASCAQFAAQQQDAEYRLACLQQKQITEGALHRSDDPGVTPDTQKEACWVERN